MNLFYLKSKDAHINLDRVEAVRHDFDTRRGGTTTLTAIHFAICPTGSGRERVVIISDPDDRALLRKHLNSC